MKAMTAGRELDALVAEKVMGWRIEKEENMGWPANAPVGLQWQPIPTYSTDISAAWEVVEKLCPEKDEFRLTLFHRQGWECTFAYFKGLSTHANTASHAICLAALKAANSEL